MAETKLTYLEGQIRNRMRSVMSARYTYSWIHRYFAIGLAIFAALNTFLVAMSQHGSTPHPWWGIGALFISALITVGSSAEGIIKPRDKYVQNAEALNAVFDIKERLNWRKRNTDEPITDEEINAFFTEFRNLEKSFFQGILKIQIEDSGKPGG